MTKYTRPLLFIHCAERPQHVLYRSFLVHESEELLRELQRIETETPQDNGIPFHHVEREVFLETHPIRGPCQVCHQNGHQGGGSNGDLSQNQLEQADDNRDSSQMKNK
jgi:hypothetical protein